MKYASLSAATAALVLAFGAGPADAQFWNRRSPDQPVPPGGVQQQQQQLPEPSQPIPQPQQPQQFDPWAGQRMEPPPPPPPGQQQWQGQPPPPPGQWQGQQPPPPPGQQQWQGQQPPPPQGQQQWQGQQAPPQDQQQWQGQQPPPQGQQQWQGQQPGQVPQYDPNRIQGLDPGALPDLSQPEGEAPPEEVTETSGEKIENPTAVFTGLDKITGRTISFDVAVDETVQFGALQVTPRVCYTRPPTEPPRTSTFVEVDEVTLESTIERIFTGWMFADSPGLNAIEHPVYDVWLTNCKTSSGEADAGSE